jgi:DnaJ-class molecular chaperone
VREALEKAMQARLARLQAAELVARAERLEAEALAVLATTDGQGAEPDGPVTTCPTCGGGPDGLRDMTTMGAARRQLFCVVCARAFDGGPAGCTPVEG